ncbi:MAG: phosphoribosylanthranilate isomerase [Thermodesulfobacteriota bacterium]
MTFIKICGLTNKEDALAAVSWGANALGFIFAPSTRQVTPQVAAEICKEVPPSIWKIGVFVNADLGEVKQIAHFCGLTALQFHGAESPLYCAQAPLPVIKTIKIKGRESLKEIDKYDQDLFLLEGFHPEKAGGTGETFPWELVLGIKGKKIILAGGLNPQNVSRAISLLRPWGVDVCSGVEKFPGKKDINKMAQFIKEVKRADARTR